MNAPPAPDPRSQEDRLLILAPFGRDSAIAAAILAEDGLAAESCATLDELIAGLDAGAACLILTQEALQSANMQPLSHWLGRQDIWSDLPVIVISEHGGGPERNPVALRLMEALGNVTFLERPFRPLTFLSLVRSALRSRRRQLHARAQMAELSRREAALRASEARFRVLAENIPVLTWIARADGWITWYNSRWYEYTGKTAEEMEGWGWQSVHDPKLLPQIIEAWQTALRDVAPVEMVFPLRGADGVFRPFLTRVVPIWQDGKLTNWFGTNVDISAEREADAAIRASEEKLRILNETLEHQVAERTARLKANEARLRAIFETSYQLQGLLAPDGTLLEINATALAHIAHVHAAAADVVGRKFWETPWFSETPGMSETVRAAILQAAGGESVRHELSLNVAGGQHSFDFSFRPVRDDAGNVVAILPEATDITTRRRAEEALRQAQKMEAVGQLTGGIAHDFNNMLQGVSAGVELTRRRIQAGRPEEAERYIEASRQSIARAAALVQRLLAFSRRQPLAPRRVILDDLVAGLAALLRQTVGPAIEVKVDVRDGCWPVKCDANQLESALLNLAINARDAMGPSGGALTVSTAHARLDATDVAGWDGTHPGEFVRISVADTGTGMSADVLEHAFEPFYTTKPAGQGTGLGLSQVFGFVSQSHGIVRIQSTPGRGTSVDLFLPRSLDAMAEATEQERAPASGSIGAARVLLVEDEAGIRQLAAEALRDAGCSVVEAQDGPRGLNALRETLGHDGRGIDILVSDVGLPGGLNGRQLADAARAMLPDLPVLLITGFAGDALATGVQEDDRMELLSKPFALDRLTARVQAMLAKP